MDDNKPSQAAPKQTPAHQNITRTLRNMTPSKHANTHTSKGTAPPKPVQIPPLTRPQKDTTPPKHTRAPHLVYPPSSTISCTQKRPTPQQSSPASEATTASHNSPQQNGGTHTHTHMHTRAHTHLKRHDPSKAGHLLDGDVVVWVGGQPGVVHPGYLGVRLQPPRQLKGAHILGGWGGSD